MNRLMNKAVFITTTLIGEKNNLITKKISGIYFESGYMPGKYPNMQVLFNILKYLPINNHLNYNLTSSEFIWNQ
jgi:hypothetical protein